MRIRTRIVRRCVAQHNRRVRLVQRQHSNGSYALFVRSGLKPIEFEKGKTAIGVPSLDKLSAFNGHFACACYHPLFVFNQFGDLERCALRSGNVHSAYGWKDVLAASIDSRLSTLSVCPMSC
jgi:hypothetical protein